MRTDALHRGASAAGDEVVGGVVDVQLGEAAGQGDISNSGKERIWAGVPIM
jgi:hypothetical protein